MHLHLKKRVLKNGYTAPGKSHPDLKNKYHRLVWLLAIPFLYSCMGNEPFEDLPAYDFSALDSTLATADFQENFPNGMSIVLRKSGQQIYQNSFGEINDNEPMIVASSSKWVSAALVLSLVDDGLISLDDEIGEYLPIFEEYDKGHITIRQCFTMTSGFEECESGKYGCPVTNEEITLEESAEQLAETQPLVYSPGSTVFYSSVGMQIVGSIAEKVTGKSWSTLFAERIAEPCNMQTSSYGDTQNPYIAGGLQTTPTDYIRFLQMVLDNGMYGNTRVLSSDAVEEFFTPQTLDATLVENPYPTPPPYHPFNVDVVHYGFGSWQDIVNPSTDEIERVSQPGAFGAFPWVDRPRNMVGFIFTNSILEETIRPELKILKLIRKIHDAEEEKETDVTTD